MDELATMIEHFFTSNNIWLHLRLQQNGVIVQEILCFDAVDQ